jgi:hypothetical protein
MVRCTLIKNCYLRHSTTFCPGGTGRLCGAIRRADELSERPSRQSPIRTGKNLFLARAGDNYIQWSVDLKAVDPAIAQEWQLPIPDRSLGELRFDFSIGR